MNQPLAYIHPEAKIARNVVIEPFVNIEKNVVVDMKTEKEMMHSEPEMREKLYHQTVKSKKTSPATTSNPVISRSTWPANRCPQKQVSVTSTTPKRSACAAKKAIPAPATKPRPNLIGVRSPI